MSSFVSRTVMLAVPPPTVDRRPVRRELSKELRTSHYASAVSQDEELFSVSQLTRWKLQHNTLPWSRWECGSASSLLPEESQPANTSTASFPLPGMVCNGLAMLCAMHQPAAGMCRGLVGESHVLPLHCHSFTNPFPNPHHHQRYTINPPAPQTRQV